MTPQLQFHNFSQRTNAHQSIQQSRTCTSYKHKAVPVSTGWYFGSVRLQERIFHSRECGAVCDVFLLRFWYCWTFCSTRLCLYVEECNVRLLTDIVFFVSEALLSLTTCSSMTADVLLQAQLEEGRILSPRPVALVIRLSQHPKVKHITVTQHHPSNLTKYWLLKTILERKQRRLLQISSLFWLDPRGSLCSPQMTDYSDATRLGVQEVATADSFILV